MVSWVALSSEIWVIEDFGSLKSQAEKRVDINLFETFYFPFLFYSSLPDRLWF